MLTAWTAQSIAEAPGKVPRIGVLSYISRGILPGTLAFFDGLRELGYVEGDTIVVDWRSAHGDATKFPELAADLVKEQGPCHRRDRQPRDPGRTRGGPGDSDCDGDAF
jgi:hypothetical protein